MSAPNSATIVLGIDPGLRSTGYGLIQSAAGMLAHLHHGVFRAKAEQRPHKLVQIHDCICSLLERWEVHEVAIEKQFVAINASSAFVIGEARSAAMLAVAQRGIPIFEYTPAQVKQTVTNYGRGSKHQIQEMVKLQFALTEAPPADAADGLAIAICHAAHRGVSAAISDALSRTLSSSVHAR